MSLLYFDGFDYINSAPISGWSNAGGGTLSYSPSSGSGRRGTGHAAGSSANSNAYRSLGGNHSTLIAGVAYARGTVNTHTIMGFTDGVPASGTSQMSVRHNTDNTFSVYRGSTLLGTTTFVAMTNVYYYVELKVVFHASAGSYELKIGNVTRLSASGISTIQTANAYANYFHLGGPSGIGDSGNTVQAYFDDLYICNASGSLNNDFLGDVRVDTVFPNAAGSETDFTSSTGGANWTTVDEPSMTSDYNYASAIGSRDLYQLSSLASLPYDEVFGVKTSVNMRTDVAGTREAKTIFVSGATEVDGTPILLPTTDMYVFSAVMETNPDTSVAWEQAEVNAVELGVEITG